jgi:hypothetical protein
MEDEIPFVRGEFLTKANKFVYLEDASKWLYKINEELELLDSRSESFSYLNRKLTRQKQRLEQKIIDLRKSIQEDINASKE